MRWSLSLTSFLKIPEVRQRFVQQFPLPKFGLKCAIKAPPVTTHYPLIGTAFDYLLRFYVEALNPSASTEGWVAEIAVAQTAEFPSLYKRASSLLNGARLEYDQFLKSKIVSDELIKAAIYLAQLDPIYRAGLLDPNLGTAEQGDITDLRKLIDVVDPELFRAVSCCFLNPTFGEASDLVGGADADMIIDHNLMDIKTTKNLEFNRNYYNQLIGYYVLAKIGNVSGVSAVTLQNVGIYYSRFALVYLIPVTVINESPNFEDFVNWFGKTAELVFSVPRGARLSVIKKQMT